MEIAYRNDNTDWASVDAEQKAEYDALEDKDLLTVNRRNGQTLRARLYSHVLSKRKKYNVTFSADTIVTDDDRAFMQAFFSALSMALKIDGTWVEVQLEGGDEPVEFIEGSKYLLEYKFVFLAVEPS